MPRASSSVQLFPFREATPLRAFLISTQVMR